MEPAKFSKVKIKNHLYIELLFTIGAFIIMVVLSCLFMNDTVLRHLARNTENIMSFEKTKIETYLQGHQMTLSSFLQTIRRMILQGDTPEMLASYVNDISRFLTESNTLESEINGVYGYFKTKSGESVFINTENWITPSNYLPESRPWYIAAIEAEGLTAATLPYTDLRTDRVVISYARSIYDDAGGLLGVACINIPVDTIGNDVVSTFYAQGGYGILVSQDLTVLAHHNRDFIGRSMRDPAIPVSVFADDVANGIDISERPVTSYTGEVSIVFFKDLANGWHLGLVTPKGPYYQSVTNMAVILSILGAVMAGVLVFVLVGIDRAKRKADSESRQKTAFLARMSHEMRTPLNAIIGLSELILENDGLNTEDQEKLGKIYNSGMTLLNTVNDILDISKIEAGKFELIPVIFDTPSLINDSVTQNILRIGEKPIKFILDIREDLPTRLFGDELRIKQILNNMLSNAIKYTNEGSVRLSIKFENENDSVWLIFEVSDTGRGIKQEDLQTLFTDYSQMDRRSNRQIEGTGLGLSITKMIVEMMDGTIDVKSEYGRGSSFTARIKTRQVTKSIIGADVVRNLKEFHYSDNKREQHLRFVRIRIPYAHVLVVDDMDTNLDVAKGMLKPYGMQVDCVSSGQKAVDAIRAAKIHYNAVFMDHMMPGIDGIEATRIIREEIGTEYAKNIPIIALTANAIIGNEEMFLGKGFQAFLSKPIEIERLDAVIRQFIRNKDIESKLQGIDANGETVIDTRSGRDRRSFINRRKFDRRTDSKEIPGLDMDRGIKRLGGDRDSYIKILGSFAINTPPLLEDLKKSTGNLHEYVITIHGIKGSSKGICADAVSAGAEALETAAKKGDSEFIKTHNSVFTGDTEILIASITEFLENRQSENTKQIKDKPDILVLTRLMEACRAYNMDGVDDAMDELENYEYENDDGLMFWLRENIDKMNFTQINEMLTKITG